MNPYSLNFNTPQSPFSPVSAKRKVLGEIQNSVFKSPIERLKSPLKDLKTSPLAQPLKQSPQIERITTPLSERTQDHSPLTSRTPKTRTSKISKVFEERSKFRMSRENKENENFSETLVKLGMEEETRDCSFGEQFQSRKEALSWSAPKLDFKDALPQKLETEDTYVPQKDQGLNDCETLQDLETEFENDNFDHCTNYEIISTESPDIISRGRSASSRKIVSRDFEFGAPIAESEQSTSFNRPNAAATRMLKFEENFEFTSPAMKKNGSVKKSLKFIETPSREDLGIDRSDSSVGSMSLSPASQKRLFTSDITTSLESGFISELEDFDVDDSNSPKVADFRDLLSGSIKSGSHGFRRSLNRSLSYNSSPIKSESKILCSIVESPKKGCKRSDDSEDAVSNKRRKSNCGPLGRVKRPVLQRALSENNASIMSAMAKSDVDPDLIGDFSQPFALPLTRGDHADLKSISCDTLAALLRGEYDHAVCQYQVIDCRYPYEFDGGHILGALNLFTQEQVLTLVSSPPQPRPAGDKRTILVFHCEFSLERGPNLTRYLRSSDRAQNQEQYPSLHYPEVYLLHAGYHSFYQRYPEFCSPNGYTAMLDPQHRHLLRKHRSMGPSTTNPRRNRLLL